MIIGAVHASRSHGNASGVENAEDVANYFSVRQDVLISALDILENADNPHLLILQYLTPKSKISAACFMSSVWSNSYAKVGTPYGRVHRDFHYQTLFSAIAALVECGCDAIRVENPMSGYLWRRDAYICLLEVVRNIQKYMRHDVKICLQEGACNELMVNQLEKDCDLFDMQEHRPVGITNSVYPPPSPSLFNAPNYRRRINLVGLNHRRAVLMGIVRFWSVASIEYPGRAAIGE